jgi:endonuclease/exonuclease/phosphatase family metal-dependent hydrolase
MSSRIRIATYNVHKCRGMDRRISVARIAEVLREVDADIIALQEILRVTNEDPKHDQVGFLASELGMEHCAFGHNRPLQGGTYGNATLSRFPIENWTNYDVSHAKPERRGCLRTDIRIGKGQQVHVMNLHLGTGFMERRAQARMLLSPELLLNGDFKDPRIVVGDFNEWTRGLATRLLSEHFVSADSKGRRVKRSYPGVLPMLRLDDVYYDGKLKLEKIAIHRSKIALVASDHLPMVAEFRVG